MKKAALVFAVAFSLLFGCSSFAADIDSMTLEELKTAYSELESENEQLESENAELKEQIEQLKTEESETEPSTEIIGTQYTDSSTVQIVQSALNAAGFDCGTPDGKAGEKTAEAIREYEKSKGINVNGVITDELLEALGVADQVSDAAKQEAAKAEYSSDYSYTTLARDPDSYIGTKVKFRGKVLQEGDAGDNIRYIRFAVDSDYDTVLFITYTSDQVSVKILDDDILTIYGTVYGEYSYETVLGAEITLPWVHTDIIDTSEVSMG